MNDTELSWASPLRKETLFIDECFTEVVSAAIFWTACMTIIYAIMNPA